MKKIIFLLLMAFQAIMSQAQDKLVALSFDDGPNTTTTVHMLDVLKKPIQTSWSSRILLTFLPSFYSFSILICDFDSGCKIRKENIKTGCFPNLCWYLTYRKNRIMQDDKNKNQTS